MSENEAKEGPPEGAAVPMAGGSIARNARLGLLLFTIYLVLYGGFMGLNAFFPEASRWTWRGVNLAIIYGLFLIAAAVALACLYVALCAREESKTTPDGAPREPQR